MSLAFKITPDDEIWDWNPETGAVAPSPPNVLCVGFSLQSRLRFTFDGMTHRGDNTGARAQLFRIDPQDAYTMRVQIILPVNLPSGRVQAFRLDPVSALFKTLPGIRRELPDVLLHGQVEVTVINPKTLVPSIPLR